MQTYLVKRVVHVTYLVNAKNATDARNKVTVGKALLIKRDDQVEMDAVRIVTDHLVNVSDVVLHPDYTKS